MFWSKFSSLPVWWRAVDNIGMNQLHCILLHRTDNPTQTGLKDKDVYYFTLNKAQTWEGFQVGWWFHNAIQVPSSAHLSDLPILVLASSSGQLKDGATVPALTSRGRGDPHHPVSLSLEKTLPRSPPAEPCQDRICSHDHSWAIVVEGGRIIMTSSAASPGCGMDVRGGE